MIDEIDAEILTLLQENGRLSNAAIAEQVGLATSAVFERIKKLERRQIIQRYAAVVDATAVGKPITAFVRLVLGGAPGCDYGVLKQQFSQYCLHNPHIVEAHSVAGEDCYILKVRVASPNHLETLLEQLRTSQFAKSSVTNMVLSTVKEQAPVAIELEKAIHA